MFKLFKDFKIVDEVRAHVVFLNTEESLQFRILGHTHSS